MIFFIGWQIVFCYMAVLIFTTTMQQWFIFKNPIKSRQSSPLVFSSNGGLTLFSDQMQLVECSRHEPLQLFGNTKEAEQER